MATSPPRHVKHSAAPQARENRLKLGQHALEQASEIGRGERGDGGRSGALVAVGSPAGTARYRSRVTVAIPAQLVALLATRRPPRGLPEPAAWLGYFNPPWSGDQKFEAL